MNLRSFFSTSNLPPANFNLILRKQLQWMLLLRVILYTLLLGITYFFSDLEFAVIVMPNSVLILLLLTVYTVSIISSVILNRLKQNFRKFGILQNILDTIFASVLIYFTGISQSIYTSVYFFSIIAGGLILPRKGGLIAAAASTLLYGTILTLEYTGVAPHYFDTFGLIPTRNLLEIINNFTVKGLTFFLAALLSAMFGMRLATTEEVLSNTIYSFDKLSHLYKNIFDNISTGIITTNDHNIITSANNAARQITGYSSMELIGENLLTIFPTINLKGSTRRQATDYEKKDGTRIRVGYSVTSLHIPEKKPAFVPRISSFEEDSKLITLQDISEIEKLERKIRQGEKLAAIGMMSASIAHDFRNPLTAISGSAQVLAKDFSPSTTIDDKENFELTNIILRESNRLISTISDFLKFARPDTAERQWFSLANCIVEVLQVCKADPLWPATCEIEIDMRPITDIWADEKQFFTVMNHLIQNSVAFCPPGNEKIVIKAEELRISDAKDILKITIADNGSGVADNHKDKIFEPFYTNRTDGTGLGLAIVRQTVEEHKGTIQVAKSDLGGAEFTINLPLI